MDQSSNPYDQFDQKPKAPPAPVANPYDQFDASKPPVQANPYDQFDQAKPTAAPPPPQGSAPLPDKVEAPPSAAPPPPPGKVEANPYDQFDVKSSAIGAGARAAAGSALPAAGGIVGGTLGGMATGAAAGALGAGPIGAAVGGLAGGVLGAIGGSGMASAAQQKAISLLPQGVQDWLGSEAQKRADQSQHPLAVEVGNLLPFAAAFGPGAELALGSRALGAAVMGGMELGQEAAQGQRPNVGRIAGSALTGAVLNKPTAIGETLMGPANRLGSELALHPLGKGPIPDIKGVGGDMAALANAKAAEQGKPVHEEAAPTQMQGRPAMGQPAATPLQEAVAKYKEAAARDKVEGSLESAARVDESLKAVGRAAKPITKDAKDPAEALSKITTEAQGKPASVGAAGSQYIEPPISASAEEGAGLLIRQRMGLQAHRTARMHYDTEPNIRVENDARVADPQAYEDNFVKYVETRTSDPSRRTLLSPELQKAADAIKAHEGDMQYFMQNLSDEDKIAFRDDYIEHIYKGAKAHAYTGYSSTQERVFPTYEDSAKAGWERKHDTLTETMQEGISVKNRWVAMKEIGVSLKEQGFVKTPAEKERPKEWKLVNSGEYRTHPVYMPQKIADDYSAMFQHYGGKWAEVVRDINSATRGVAFFGPPYHLLTEIVESGINDWAGAIEHARLGKPVSAAKDIASAMTFLGLPKNYLKGRAGMNYYKSGKTVGASTSFEKMIATIKGQATPEAAMIVDRLTSGNVPQTRTSMDLALGNVSPLQYMKRHGFLNTLKQGVSSSSLSWAATKAKEGAAYSAQHPLYAAGNAAHGIIKGIAKTSTEIMGPLFGEIIPKAKFGANMTKFKSWMEANPGATFEQQLSAVDKIRYNSDNLFGEMVRDNMGWHRGLIMAADILFQAPGWNVGTARSVGRGIQGAVTHPLTSTSMASKNWNPSVATAFGMILGTIWTGYVANKLLTGKDPKTVEDIFAPPTGGKSEYGTPARIAPFADASFVGDFMTGVGYPGLGSAGYVSQTAAPLGAMKGKMNRLPALAIDELITGRDYKGQPIFGEDPFKQGVMYALKNLGPFSLGERGALTEASSRAGIPWWARALGVREAGMAYSNPEGFKAYMKRKIGVPPDEQKKKPHHEDSR